MTPINSQSKHLFREKTPINQIDTSEDIENDINPTSTPSLPGAMKSSQIGLDKQAKHSRLMMRLGYISLGLLLFLSSIALIISNHLDYQTYNTVEVHTMETSRVYPSISNQGPNRLLFDWVKVSAAVQNDLFSIYLTQSHKFLLQNYNTKKFKIETVKWGNWGSKYSDLISLIDPKIAQLAFIYLELEKERVPVLMVYAPESRYPHPEAVYHLFGLTDNPHSLRLIGLRVYVARNMKDLALNKVLDSILQDNGHTIKTKPNVTCDPKRESDKNLAILHNDRGQRIIQTAMSGKMKYTIWKRNHVDNMTYLHAKGEWDGSFQIFSLDFDDDEEQVGFIYMQLETITKPIAVIYIPEHSPADRTPSRILRDFELPVNEKQLWESGVGVFVARSRNEITIPNVLGAVYERCQSPKS